MDVEEPEIIEDDLTDGGLNEVASKQRLPCIAQYCHKILQGLVERVEARWVCSKSLLRNMDIDGFSG